MASSTSLQATFPLPLSTARFRYKPSPTSIPTSSTLFPVRLHPSLSLVSSSTLVLSPHTRRHDHFNASAAVSEAIDAPSSDADFVNHENADALEPQKEKLKVVIKTVEKPRLVLKFIWMDKNIGLGLDQMIPGHGSVPLSPYYFWPRKDAWEELKTKLEEKSWISQKRMIILLNQATDIINLWQQAGGSL